MNSSRQARTIKHNFWTQIKKPFLALAPMAGITDQPFCIICKEFGADVLYSEMISSEALFHNAISNFQLPISNKIPKSKCQILKTLELIKFSKIERPYVVQIFGADPVHMAYAAEYIASGEWNKDYEKMSKFKENCKLKITSIPSGIDVNMGCPSQDIIKTGTGAALLKNPKLVEKIIKTIKKKVKNIPISVKTRIGWNDNKNTLTFCRMLECCGVDAIAIHGRTVKQGFAGEVDWETIYKVKKVLKIPVIGNGGISINSNVKCQMSNLDGIMIGQGACGRPWVFRNIKSEISKCKTTIRHREEFFEDDAATSSDIYRDCFASEFTLSTVERARNDIKKIVLKHAKLVEKLKGERGIIEFRKHLGWYFRGTPFAKQTRKQLVNVNSLEDVKSVLELNREK